MENERSLMVYGLESKALEALVRDRNPAANYLQAGGLTSDGSKQARLDGLRVFLGILRLKDDAAEPIDLDLPSKAEVYAFDWGRLTADDLRVVKTRLQNRTFRMTRTVTRKAGDGGTVREQVTVRTAPYSLRSQAKVLGSARALVAWMVEAGQHPAHVTAEGVLGVQLPKVAIDTPARYGARDVPEADITKLVAACGQGGDLGVRDAAILALGFVCGVRASELCSLTLRDYQSDSPEDGTDTIALRMTKGGGGDPLAHSTESVYISNGARTLLRAWLRVRGRAPGALFCAFDAKGKPNPKRAITRKTLGGITRNRSRQAKVRPFGPHDMRRTFAADARRKDPKAAQTMGRWRQESMIAHYDRRGRQAMLVGLAKMMTFPVEGITRKAKGKPKGGRRGRAK